MTDSVIDEFQRRFDADPVFVVSCPGRVNIIGEHVDYSGYSVLPMALQQCVLAAVRPTHDDGMLHIANVNSAVYEDYQQSACDYEFELTKGEAPKWYHYFLCGFRGILERLEEMRLGASGDNKRRPSVIGRFGMQVMIEGNVPPSAGLSSSSALVCASALATLRAATHRDFDHISKSMLADLCAKAERYIGTQGGGMDQAISFLAERGAAKHIEFNPLRAQNVRLPQGVCFVVANSCVKADKAATAHFNTRVVECRLAAKLLVHGRKANWRGIERLGEAQQQLGQDLQAMQTTCRGLLKSDAYSQKEICSALNVTQSILSDSVLTANTQHVDVFRCQARALHCFSEAERVQKFIETCELSPSSSHAAAEQLSILGQLMNDSHESLKVDYEASCAELDELVDICRQTGAYGARLTGAGWGGCIVALVAVEEADILMDALLQQYYKKIGICESREDEVFKRSCFVSEPAPGARVQVLRNRSM